MMPLGKLMLWWPVDSSDSVMLVNFQTYLYFHILLTSLHLLFEGAIALYQSDNVAQLRAGTGTIWLDDVNCVGNETQLTSCLSNAIGVHNCVHNEDVGVRCEPRNFRGTICSFFREASILLCILTPSI